MREANAGQTFCAARTVASVQVGTVHPDDMHVPPPHKCQSTNDLQRTSNEAQGQSQQEQPFALHQLAPAAYDAAREHEGNESKEG